MKYREFYIMANCQIKNILNFIKENEKAFEYINLKLYDAFNYYINDFEKDYPSLAEEDKMLMVDRVYKETYFDKFCSSYYEDFLYECDGYDWEFEKLKNYIGRTSSFYLHDITISRNDYLIYDLYEASVGGYDFNYIKLETDGMIAFEENQEYQNYAIEGLDYIGNYFYSDVVKYCKPIIECYTLIEKYKQNQVKAFKEFLDFCLENNN